MRIAIVLPYNPLLERTGLQNLACRFAQVLRRQQGHKDPTIVTIGPSGRIDGVEVRGVPSFLRLLLEVSLPQWNLVHWLEVWPDRRVWLQHSISLLNRCRCRQVLTTETVGNLTKRGGGRLSRWLYRRAYHCYVVSNEAYLAEYAAAGIPRNQIAIVPHGLDPSEPFRPITGEARRKLKRQLSLDPKKKLVLFLGRLVERKRPTDFVEAMKKLLASRSDFEAVIVGDSSNHEDTVDEHLRRAVSDADLPALVWRPFTERPWEYFSVADVAVTPSDRDGEAFTVLEAMASGAVPVVSSLPILKSIVEWNEGRGGLVFEIGHVDGLAKSVESLLDNDKLREELRYANLEHMRTSRNLRQICKDHLESAYSRPSR